MSALPEDRLEPTPTGGTWGRSAATVYLVVAGLAFALMVSELVKGSGGLGTLAISVLTAPWSGLLAPLARFLHGRVSDGALRAIGIVLVVLSALLNAAVIRGVAARAERDAHGMRR